MRSSSASRAFVTLIALAASMGARADDTPVVDAPVFDDTAHFGLTISGGISLGAYEAGLNWSLVRLLKTFKQGGLRARMGQALSGAPLGAALSNAAPDKTLLSAVTGASAGNINAFLTAAAWCQKDGDAFLGKPETARNNVFFHTWTDIGLGKLFPPSDRTCADYKKHAVPEKCHDDATSDECRAVHLACKEGESPYADDDALFTRGAFAQVIFDAQRFFNESNFDTACEIPLGITLTKVVPRQLSIDGEGLRVPTQRHAVQMRVKSESGKGVTFWNEPHPSTKPGTEVTSTAFGELFLPPTDDAGRIEMRDVVRMVQAASAFPVAFGPLDLQSRTGSTAAYLDGGVFDNIPLGLLVNLLETTPGGSDAAVIYLQPSNLRLTPEKIALAPSQVDARGLSQQLDFVAGAVGSAMGYELAFAQRERLRLRATNPNAKVPFPVRLTSRYSQIFGAQLINFGAFVSHELRKHDYYVGVYDGLYSASYEICSRAMGLRGDHDSASARQTAGEGNESLAKDLQTCVRATLPVARDIILPNHGSAGTAGTNMDDTDARYVVNRLFCAELGDVAVDDPRKRFRQDNAPLATGTEPCAAVQQENATRRDVLRAQMDVAEAIMKEQSLLLDELPGVLQRWLDDNEYDVTTLAGHLSSNDDQCGGAVVGCTKQNVEELRAEFRAVLKKLQDANADTFETMMAKLGEDPLTKRWFVACAGNHENPDAVRAECADVVQLMDDYDGWWAHFARNAMWRLESVEKAVDDKSKLTIVGITPSQIVDVADFGLRSWDQVHGTGERRWAYFTNTSTASLREWDGAVLAFATPSYIGLDVGQLGVEAGYRPFAWRPNSLSFSLGVEGGVRRKERAAGALVDWDVGPSVVAQWRGLFVQTFGMELAWRPIVGARDDVFLVSPVGAEVAILVFDKARIGLRWQDTGGALPIYASGPPSRTADTFLTYIAISDIGGIIYWVGALAMDGA